MGGQQRQCHRGRSPRSRAFRDFTLQVAESTEGADGAQQLSEWQDAAGYFAENLSQEPAGSGESVYESIFGSGTDAYKFTKTVSGNINDDEVWGKDVRHLFTELPYFIKKLNSTGSEDMTELVYRVVESKISYVADGSEVSQSVTVTEDQGSSNYKLDFSGASVDGTGGSLRDSFHGIP